MTERTKENLIAAAVGLLLIGVSYIIFQYFILPELPPMFRNEAGEWVCITESTLRPYGTDLAFSEWPIGLQQGFFQVAVIAFCTPFCFLFVVRTIADIIDWIRDIFAI